MVKMHLLQGTMQNLMTKFKESHRRVSFLAPFTPEELRLHHIKELKVINMLPLERKWKN